MNTIFTHIFCAAVGAFVGTFLTTLVSVTGKDDTAPVVRCGECRFSGKHKLQHHWDDSNYCLNPNAGMGTGVELDPMDFCSYGERRGEYDGDS